MNDRRFRPDYLVFSGDFDYLYLRERLPAIVSTWWGGTIRWGGRGGLTAGRRSTDKALTGSLPGCDDIGLGFTPRGTSAYADRSVQTIRSGTGDRGMTVPGTHRIAASLIPTQTKAAFTPSQMPRQGIAPSIPPAMRTNARRRVPVASRGLRRPYEACRISPAPDRECFGPSPGGGE